VAQPIIASYYHGSTKDFVLEQLPAEVTPGMVERANDAQRLYSEHLNHFWLAPDGKLVFSLGSPHHIIWSIGALHRALMDIFRMQQPLVFPDGNGFLQRLPDGRFDRFIQRHLVLIGSN